MKSEEVLTFVSQICWPRDCGVRFQSELGVAPAAYVRQKRFALAEKLLKESRLTIREVAMRCGAGTLQAFTAQFKQAYGVPPGVFRQSGALTVFRRVLA